MKKLFTVAILGLLSTGAFAQTTQGTKVVSGSVGISTSQQKDENLNETGKIIHTNFNISPSVGYFINDELELGAEIGLSYSKSKYNNEKESYESTSEGTNKEIGLSPYIKKYFMLSEKVALTGAASAGFSVGRYKSEANYSPTPYKHSINRFQAGIAPGITFFPTENIGLSAAFGWLGYRYVSTKSEEGQSKSSSSNFGLDLNSSTLGIGFSYYINR
jgi:hypothetical protein